MGEKWIVPVLFLILPFALIAPGLIWRSQQLFFIVMPVFIIAFVIKNKWVKAFILYVSAWQIFMFFYSMGKPNAGPGPALSCTLAITAAAIIYKFVSESKLPIEKWYSVLRIAVMIQVAIGVSQFSGFNPVAWLYSHIIQVKEMLPQHMVGSLGNRNYLAAFIAYTLPMFIIWRRGIFLPAIALMFILCPSPATVAGILGAAFYFAYSQGANPKRIGAYVSIALLAAAGFTAIYVLSTGYHLNEFKDLPGQLSQFFNKGKVNFDVFQGDLGRFGMWLMALGHLISTPFGMVLGFGPGAPWGREYPLHSEYMAVWFYFGLVGLFMLFGYIRESWKFLWKSKNRVLLTSFLIILVEMGANHPFEIATTGMLGVIILGLIERERLNGRLSHI